MNNYVGDIPGVLDAPQGLPPVRQELPKIIVGLNHIDRTFMDQVCQAIGLYVNDAYTVSIWTFIVQECSRQILDAYTHSPVGFLHILGTLPDMRWLETQQLMEYLPGLQSAEFASAVRVYGMNLFNILQRQAFPLDRYDIFLETYWEGALVLSVYTKTIMYPEL